MMDTAISPVAKLLIVDDEAALMTALCQTLQDEGYETQGFTSGKTALAAFREHEFDVVLTDLMMPNMDGIALIAACRAIEPNLVSIVMTGQGTIETAVQAMQAGALDYILKPFKLRQILPVLTRALTVRRLRRANADLERRVQLRSAQLEAANKDLEAFSYSVSHDLRAPLRIISGFADFLAQDSRARLSPDGQNAVDSIRAASDRMGELITDLLKLAHVSRGELSRTTVAMSKLVREVLDELLREHAARNVATKIAAIPDCRGDESLLRQVWTNLLSNALKFSAKRTDAAIEIGGSRAGDELVYFVRDNGAGFDMAQGDKLFGVFQRLHSKEEFSGTGIGLSIVQRIVNRHGGRVWAESEIDRGATFYFSLADENFQESERS